MKTYEPKVSEVCYKCAFFDTRLPIEQGYRCKAGSCPVLHLSRKTIDKLIEEKNDKK